MFKDLAKITDTFLGIEDHGIFTSEIFVSYGSGGSQGIGGYYLDSYIPEKKRRVGTAFGMEFIARTLKICGVDSWEKLKGRTIYVLKEDDSLGSKVLGIESLPTEGTASFIFSDLISELGD